MTDKLSLRLLSESDIRSVNLSLHEVLNLIEHTYLLDAGGFVEVPTKIGVHPDYPNSFLHAMPAWVNEVRALGMKWVSYFPGNFDRGMADSTGIIILNHPDHGHPVAVMEGMYVTFLRTAACATVAAKHLAPKPPRTLGLVGCGGLGRWSLHTMTAAFPSIERVVVSSRTARSREAFCEEMRQGGRWTITPVDDVRQAVEGCDIVVSSVPPNGERPVRADWLAPGSIFVPLDLANSWHDDVLGATTRVVADNASHFTAQIARQRPEASPQLKQIVTFQDLVAGRAERAREEDRSFVAVCGIASTDVVLGWEIYRRAAAGNIGTLFKMA